MEFLFFLLFLTTCHGTPIDVQQAPQLNLPAPRFTSFETVDDPNKITSHEIVKWTAVESNEPDNPVIGYKLNVWVVNSIKRTIYKKQGGEVVRLLEESYPEISLISIPDGVPTVITTGANETTATYPGMEVNVVYQFAVQAFTAMGDGPLSAPFRIRLRPKNEVAELEDLVSIKKETRY